MRKFIPVYYFGLLGTLGLPTAALAQGTPAPPKPKPAAAKPAAKPVLAKPALVRPAPAKPILAKPAPPKPAAAAPVPAKAAPAPAPAVTATADPAPAPAPVTRQAATGPAVHYAVSFPNAVHHEARIKATFAGLTPGKTLTVRMARSSPGRYALHEFIKNVYYVTATDGGGKLLSVNRSDPYSWDIKPGADGTVQVEYTVFGDRSDGTYAGIDQQHAHLNMPATLCYAQGLEGRAAEVKFELPSGWKVATQLRPLGDDRTTFAAPNLQYLMDSPVVMGAQHALHTWQDGGRTFEMATFYPGSASEVETLVKKAQQVIREAAGIFGGEYPAFDYGRYTFLADYLPQSTSDGMEHRNSTSLTSPLALNEEGMLRNLGTVSHEFFHAYNTERLRSKGLEPFDFQRVNMSDALWFGEGFTQYYGELMLRRAGYYDNEQFLDKVSQWVNMRVNAPGARYASAVDMSRQAGFVDAATSVDPQNRVNTYMSYYYQGAGIALTLDLQLRQRYRTSLDKYMLALWQEFGKPQTPAFAPAKPYTLPDLQRVLGTVAKDTAFAGTFFRRYVYGHELPRFSENLALAGLAVIPNKVLAAALPRQVEFTEDGRCILSRNTTMGSGLYKAGIDRGDEIMTLDGVKITDMATLEGVMRKHTPADLVPVHVRNRAGIERTTQVVLTEDTNVQVQPMESVEKMTATQAQKDLRAAWLASAAAIKQ